MHLGIIDYLSNAKDLDEAYYLVLQRRIYITLTQHSHTGDALITGGAAAALENTLLKFVR